MHLSSYRADISGVLGLLFFLKLLLKYYGMEIEESPSWLCDNDALVKIYRKYNKTKTNSYQENLFLDTADEYITSTIERYTLLLERKILSKV